jgi:hypothetical protein
MQQHGRITVIGRCVIANRIPTFNRRLIPVPTVVPSQLDVVKCLNRTNQIVGFGLGRS